MKLIDKSRYDSDDEEWIIPFVKRKDVDDRLPGIGGNNSNGNNGILSENNSRSNSARPESGSTRRRNNNKSSRGGGGGADLDSQEKESYIAMRQNEFKDDNKQYGNGNENGNGSDVPALSIPRHAPSKPPIAKNSARREKKKSKNETEGYIKTDLVSFSLWY